jgi:hypothetical protein
VLFRSLATSLVAHSKSISGAILNKRQLDFGPTGNRDDRARVRWDSEITAATCEIQHRNAWR